MEVKNISSNFRLRGFNLTELMIALGLSTVIVAAAIIYAFRFSEKARIEIVKAELREKVQVALRRMEMDFYTAVRITAPRDEGFIPGVYRRSETGGLAGPRTDPTENDGIVIFGVRHKELSVPLRNVAVVPPGTAGAPPSSSGLLRVEFRTDTLDAPSGTDPNDPAAVLAWNAQRYMNRASQDFSYFLISNSTTSIILPKVDFSQVVSGSRRGFLSLPNISGGHGLTTADFVEVPRIYTLSQVHYFVENGNLYRGETWTDDIPTAANSEIIIPNVTQFQVNYLFADRRPTRDTNPLVLPIAGENYPTVDLSHPAEFHGVESRLAWSDISAILGSIRVFSEETVEADDVELDRTSFEIAGGRLFYNARFASNPVAFETLLKNSQEIDFDTCHPNDIINSRCNPSCQNVFDDPDRNSVRWEGYGRHLGTTHPDGPSDYCRCGQHPTTQEFILPESSQGFQAVPSWREDLNSEDKQRIYACMEEFANCSNDWRNKDPRIRLVCGCVHNTNEFLSYDGDGKLIWNPTDRVPAGQAWSDLESVLEALDAGANPLTLEQEHVNQLRCTWWQTCGGLAEWWLSGIGSSGNPTGGDTHGGYGQYCKCLTHVIDSNGNATTQSISEKDYNILCDPTTCGNLYADTTDPNHPVFKIYGQSSSGGQPPEQALTQNEATLCQCRDDHPSPAGDYRQANGPDGNPLPVVNFTSGSPSLPGSGTVGSKVSTVRTENGDLVNQVCNQAQCNVTGGIGCCAVRSLSGSSLTAWNNAVSPANSHVRETHSGYCHSSCPGNGNADLAATRRSIFGVAGNNELPSYCKGPSGGGGGSTGPMQ